MSRVDKKPKSEEPRLEKHNTTEGPRLEKHNTSEKLNNLQTIDLKTSIKVVKK